ncbi:PadR family transcriptional regulator [Paenibacillus caseinilyticus]|uniref:PadR family transcriptional regulator n=1 Tax=Paenibacillus mucilaginosus K02 TaxID=997761 RepID=I0BH38_9BACL|nr:PadR family transcriptional regulator [Paenibacillus mucilaginosus]AFH61685.1 PadR family transcriptional regulator [Paenibacillus mucilaginosus K02]
MEYVLLGLLALRGQTIYELSKNMKNTVALFYSDSLGGIQAALKKLMDKEWISCIEIVEHGKLKKVYSIEAPGREQLLDWLRSPIPIDKLKDLAVARLFFLGLLPAADRTGVLESYAASLTEMHRHLTALEIQAALMEPEIPEDKRDIYRCQMLSLRYGVDQYAFSAKWYAELLQNMREGGGRSDGSLHGA